MYLYLPCPGVEINLGFWAMGDIFLTMEFRRKVKMLVAQFCLTLCDPLDCSLPDSSVHGVLQGRILAWIASPFSMGSS